MMRQQTGNKGRKKKKGEKLVLKMLMKCVNFTDFGFLFILQ